jgi:hypothetical protein
MSAPGDEPDLSSRGKEGTGPRRSLDHIDPVVVLLDLTIVILVVSLVLGLFQAVFGEPPQ